MWFKKMSVKQILNNLCKGETFCLLYEHFRDVRKAFHRRVSMCPGFLHFVPPIVQNDLIWLMLACNYFLKNLFHTPQPHKPI